MLRFYLGFTAKNIWRRKRRTILTAAAIAIGIMYFVMFDSLLAGADRDAQINTIDFETGHLWVGASQEGDATLARPTLEDTIPSGQAVAQAIAELPGVAGAAPRLVFPASLIAGLDELPVSAAGVDPEVDPQVFRISQFVSSGRWLERGEDGVVLGKRIADLLQLEPGDMVTVRTQTAQMAFQAVDLIVVGTVETPHPLVNQSQAFMPLDVAQAAVGAPGSATSIHVRAQSAAPSPSRRDLSGLPYPCSLPRTPAGAYTPGTTLRHSLLSDQPSEFSPWSSSGSWSSSQSSAWSIRFSYLHWNECARSGCSRPWAWMKAISQSSS